tara:strand:+ start:1410 stop:1697 length:288 start_codon:yes stop_codon:yes gene_type:complete
MAKKDSNTDLVKRIIKQISGDLTSEDRLVPEVAIDGAGEIWLWDPANRTHKKVYRGVKAFILYENYDNFGRTLIYTHAGEMVCIDPEELIHTGYD